MTLKYYLKYCLWGLVGCGYLVYLILTGLREGKILPAYAPYMPYIATYLAIGAVILPFAFYVLEQLSLKIMKKETWDNHFGADSPSWCAFVFVYLLCILLSIPLLLLYPAVNISRSDN
ncbi:hypothetical protein [Enterobacter hormaechei]|uniref:hypothetical protein n=1 Tax=Enterobacter hormaechei TaxID=158836 RepID=UPI001D111C66|nr:hypothetical protein [Enterobacter hormaechei]MCC2919090.1 hypothetical protein [Enterobacter hormaechei]